MGLTGLKARFCKAVFLREVPGENLLPSSAVSRGYPCSLACGPLPGTTSPNPCFCPYISFSDFDPLASL